MDTGCDGGDVKRVDNEGVVPRLAELEQALASQEAELRALRRERDFYRALLEDSGIGIMACDTGGELLVFNRILREWCELSDVPTDLRGWSRLPHFRGLDGVTPMPEEVAPLRSVLAGERLWEAPLSIAASGKPPREVLASGNTLRDEQGVLMGAAVFMNDVTEQKRAEKALRESLLNEELARARAASLEELSTPLIPISSDVLVMPLVGAIDSGRMARLMETLLAGIAERRAQVVILDITGVPAADEQVAEGLIRVAQAVRLLGARVVLTGICPEVSRRLVSMGANWSGLAIRSSLQAGIAFAMRREAPRQGVALR